MISYRVSLWSYRVLGLLALLALPLPMLAAEHLVDCQAGASLRDLQRALNGARCGDTLRIRGRCEAFGEQLRISKHCTAGRALRFIGEGPEAQLNGTYPDFRSAPNDEWVLVNAQHNEYRSRDRFPRWEERPRGHFREPRSGWNALVPYPDLERLRASEYGPRDQRYAGPGVAYDRGSDRLHIRLAGLPGIAKDCGIYDPGDHDPNQIPIEISHGVEGTLVFESSAAHILWSGIDVIGGRFAVAILDGARDLVIRDARIRGNKVAINARTRVKRLHTENNRLETLAPVWVSWDEQKNSGLGWDGTGMIGLNTGDDLDGLVVTRSFFDRPFDVLSPAGSNTRNVEFSHNTVNWNGDDAWQLGTHGAAHFRAFRNHFLRAANTWSRSFSGGATRDKGTLLFFLNVIDGYNGALKLHSKPEQPGAPASRAEHFQANFRGNGSYYAGRDDPGVRRDDAKGCFHTKAPHGTHGKGGYQSVKYYQNTYVLGGAQRSSWGGWQAGADPADVQHLKNNIIVWHADQPVLRDWEADARFDADGNLWHLPARSPKTDMFKSMPGNYRDLATYQGATGRSPHSREVDPQLLDAQPGGRYCPAADGPAARRTVALDPAVFPGVEGVLYVGAVDPADCTTADLRDLAGPTPPNATSEQSSTASP